jgi:hypothetical protein
VAEEVRAALRAEGAVTGPQRFTTPAVSVRPRSLKRILDKLCAAAGVEVRLDTQIIAAHRDEGRIASLQVAGKAREVGAARRVRRIWPASAEPRSDTATTAWCRTARWACASVACRRSVQGVREAVHAARAQAVGPAL